MKKLLVLLTGVLLTLNVFSQWTFYQTGDSVGWPNFQGKILVNSISNEIVFNGVGQDFHNPIDSNQVFNVMNYTDSTVRRVVVLEKEGGFVATEDANGVMQTGLIQNFDDNGEYQIILGAFDIPNTSLNMVHVSKFGIKLGRVNMSNGSLEYGMFLDETGFKVLFNNQVEFEVDNPNN